MIGYQHNPPGFGAYRVPDYRCAATGGGNFVCKGTRGDVSGAFGALQQTVKTIAAKMAKAGRLNVPSNLAVLVVDNEIGKITTLGVQFIGVAFAAVKAPPADVAAAFASGLTAEQAVERIAAAAVEINTYLVDVLTNFPDAITKPLVTEKGKWGIVVVSIGALAVVGVVAWLAKREAEANEENRRWF